MKKATSVKRVSLRKQFIITIGLYLITVLVGYAVPKTSTGGNWNTPGTWSPSGVPTSTDDVTITSGTVNVDVNANCGNITINAGATLSFNNNSLTVAGNWTNNGTFNHGCQCAANTVIMTGNGTTLGGSSVSMFNNLTINTPSNTNVISLLNSNIKIDNSGTLTLQNGVLKIGAANALTMSNGQAVTITSVNGNFANANDGTGLHTNADGGTINAFTQSGANINVNGNVVFNNILSTADGNWHLNLNSTAARINGTLTADGGSSWGYSTIGNPPIWGPASTFYYDRANQGIPSNWLTAGTDKTWTTNTGTIGVTPGYPNNVTLVNMGSSSGGTGGTGWVPTGAVGLNGTLQIGDASTNGRISLENVTGFNSGGIVVENNSLMVGPPTAATFVDRGNFTLNGATTGIFQSMGATINFAGSGTIGTPQTISTSGAAITFTNMTVSNGTYVQLQDPLNVTGVLTLTAGYVGTTTTNILTVNNTANSAIVGGSTTAYINGPLAWSIPATTTGNYVFPIGDLVNNGGEYLPLTLSPNSTSGATATATAFNLNSFGIPGPSVTSISNGEYWSLTTSSPFSSGPLVSVSRQSAVTPNNALAVGSTSSGIYNAIGGSPSGSTMSGGGIGTASPAFIVIVQAPLSVVKLSGKNYACSGSVGSLTVGGSGGTAPYTYRVDGIGLFVASGVFDPLSAGDHTVEVKDNTGTIASSILKVLGSVVINGNNLDVDLCSGQSTTLVATNLQNASPTYSWSTGASTASITVTPLVPTTYTVTSTLYNNNLITNGSFESGNTGFTSSYTNYVGAQYGSTPGNNGYYTISNAGTNQCQWFSTNGTSNGPSLPVQNGGVYFIGDGATASSIVWSQNLTGLTIGTVYKFQYYYAAADPDATQAQLRTNIGGTNLGTVTTTSATAWTQVVYMFTATATTTTITITNLTATGSTNGNDFYLDNLEFLVPCTVTSSINVTINCSLPVSLIEFNVIKKGNGALLTWLTGAEKNSSHFIVEKSTDGILFKGIGKIEAKGNSNALQNYSFVDPIVVSGTTYYRLAQYDLDGTVNYSEIKTVSNNLNKIVQVIPNPNNGNFVITIEGDIISKVTIINALGQQVYVSAASNDNVANIDISLFAAGVYYLYVNTSEDVFVEKIIKE